jgi:peptidyl-prolyl cis-trans isomerase D
MKLLKLLQIKCFTQATKFEMESADKGFDKVAKEWDKIPAHATDMDENFGPPRNQRSIVRWAFLKMILR